MSHVVDAQGHYVRVGDRLTHIWSDVPPCWFVAVAGTNTLWVADNEKLEGDLVAMYAWRFRVEVVR